MTSPDDKSLTALRSWWTLGKVIDVSFSIGEGVFFSAWGQLSNVDDDGFNVGCKLPVTEDPWTLGVVFEAVDGVSSSTSEDAPLKLIVTVKVGHLTITLVGPDPLIKPVGFG